MTLPLEKSEVEESNHTRSIFKLKSTPRLVHSTIINQYQNFGWIESPNYPNLSIYQINQNQGMLLNIIVFNKNTL